jgi:hypothetical protein
MEEYEKQALLYSYIDFSNDSGGTGPKEILKPIIQRAIYALQKMTFTLEELEQGIYKEFAKHIDLLIIRTALTRLQHHEELIYDQDDKKYTYLKPITNYNEQYKLAKESSECFQRELKIYIDKITDKFSTITISKVFKYFCSFIQLNIDEFIKLLVNKNKNLDIKYDNTISPFIEKFVFDKILTEEKSFDAFERIFNGLILLYIYENCNDLFQQENPFGEKHFFLDTNILLRILGLQDPLQNKMGNELLGYLSDKNFKIAITNDTWLEICSLINGYKYNCNMISIKGKVSHIYQIMKNNNIIPEEIEDFIKKIETHLNDLGIEIGSPIKIASVDYPELETRVMELAKKKYENKCDLLGEYFNPDKDTPELYIRQADHDLRNIYNIIYLRNEIKNKSFFNEKYYFITADWILKNYLKENVRHTGQAFAIGDGTLAFLLYYKNPKNTKGFSVQSFINAHFDSKKLSIKNWYMYYDSVKEKYKSNQITKEQAGYLLCRVILDNEKFSVTGIENIIDEAIKYYEEQEIEYQNAISEARQTRKENEEYKNLFDSMVKNTIDENTRMNSLTQQINNESEKNEKLATTIIKQSEVIREQSIIIKVFIVLLVIISISLFMTNNTIIGSITTILTIVTSVLEIYKYFKNRN